MKLFEVSYIDEDNDEIRNYLVRESEENVKQDVIKEFKKNHITDFHCLYIGEISMVDGYKIKLEKIKTSKDEMEEK